jgi:hypothetical protein
MMVWVILDTEDTGIMDPRFTSESKVFYDELAALHYRDYLMRMYRGSLTVSRSDVTKYLIRGVELEGPGGVAVH